MKVLVVGGAGYVGSHVVHEMVSRGYEVEVLDNLSTGYQDLLPPPTLLHVADAYDPACVTPLVRTGEFDAVMHFAALSLVGDSVQNPRRYFETNVAGGLRLIGACLDADVDKFILSSSAAVYGEPTTVPIPEDHPLRPTSPYGSTKVALESALEAYGKAYGLKHFALRYFNAAGAHPSGTCGERHDPETHLIPNILRAALARRPVRVFGVDYPTRDGSAVRDYIHVLDLADAHILALEALASGNPGGALNLGSDVGMSVFEVIAGAKRVTGLDIQVEPAPRRHGDPAVLIADSTRARQALGWCPRYTSIDSIVETAWQWHRREADGSPGG